MKIVKDYNEIKINLPVLATENYLKCKSSEYGWFENENFVLPFFIDKRLVFKRMVFTMALIPKGEFGLNDEKEFLDELVDFVKKLKICDFIAKPQSNVYFNYCPKNSDCIEWGTYITDIDKNNEELLKSFHSKHRNVIRKAIKDGVKIEVTNDTKLIFKNIKETLLRQKSPYFPSLSYIECLKANISDNLLLLIAKKNNVIQGSAIIIYDNEKGYYMYGGSIQKPYIGSINLLQYEAMKILRDKGVRFYDFVGARLCVNKGSKFEGIQKFKSRFGAELKKGYTFRIVINPLKFKLFNIVVKTYLGLKGLKYEEPIDSIRKCK
ncbi:lipid II:glycine glycyltransferase FemX [Nitrosophilus labii]|uniref:lipid II:glycine glycyltransferase FemX n=1 Tax=Nitrosophilus labii TaxID=2706014 RepID=UPI0016573BAC|nr:peptidoglycan bridge formation glycyltransferase FemA/FemB family protein [Nitrosophilus labii]